jgi:hypothetical protein
MEAAILTSPARLAQNEKNLRLLELILQVQMEVMEDVGYEGEDGYIKLQTALMGPAAAHFPSRSQPWDVSPGGWSQTTRRTRSL